MKLVLVRHGQTYANAEAIHQGWSNVALSELGKKQAEKVREKLSERHFDVIYSSDLCRAVETAEIIACNYPSTINFTQLLREVNVGNISGVSYDTAQKQYGEKYLKCTQEYNFDLFNGETAQEFKERAGRFLRQFEECAENKSILVITHGGLMRAIMSYILGIEISKIAKRISFKNCCISEIEFDHMGWKINSLNS